MSCEKCGGGSPVPVLAKEALQAVGDVVLRSCKNIALVGNPNVGKSSLFNRLTGSRQRVINAPGTTVEVFTGKIRHSAVRVIDTPGTYSLVPTSPDEEVVVGTLAGAEGSLTDSSRPDGGLDLVILTLDATALSRSLYLLAQVAQTGLPVGVVLTMQDVAQRRGESIDAVQLSCLLGVPVVVANPRTGQGLEDVLEMIQQCLATPYYVQGLRWDIGAPGFNRAAQIRACARYEAQKRQECGCQEITQDTELAEKTSITSIRDLGIPQLLGVSQVAPCGDPEGCVTAAILPELVTESSPDADRATQLFDWIADIETGLREERIEVPPITPSDRLDRVLLHPVWGTGIFMVSIYVVFWLANTFAAVFQGPLEGIIAGVGGWDFVIPENLLKIPFTDIGIPGKDVVLLTAPSLADGLIALLTVIGWEGGVLQGLLIDGLLTGVAVVLSFAPLMIVMFAAIAVMEDSGYMARVAFLGDRLMRRIGLDGRVIMPFIVGFGCNLPTLAALRTVPDTRQRLMAVILTPYITCSARMIVYLFIAQVFFAQHAAEVVWVMYFLSVVIVILGGLVLRPLFLRGVKEVPLLLVLPPFQSPRGLVLFSSAAARTGAFLAGAGKVIVVMTAVIWVLMVTPVTGEGRFGDSLPPDESAYGVAASAVAPVFAPAGFGDWHLTGSLITGFVAKETMLGSLAATYTDAAVTEDDVNAAQDEGSVTKTMRGLTQETFASAAGSEAAAPIAAFAFLIFVLTYTPCLATVAEQWRQLGARLTLTAVGSQLAVAWLLAVLIFQIGRLFV